MFSLDTNLYDTPPAWWEMNCVKFGWVNILSIFIVIMTKMRQLIGSVTHP